MGFVNTEAMMVELGDAADTILQLDGDFREGTMDTARRFGAAWLEMTSGYEMRPQLTTFDSEGADQMVCQWDIPVLSNCEHHLLPFVGYAHIGYIPRDKIIGLSKFALVVDMYARRLQNQERMTRQIAVHLDNTLNPRGVIIRVECEHLCMVMRKKVPPGTKTTTNAVTGDFLDPKQGSREEFMALYQGRK